MFGFTRNAHFPALSRFSQAGTKRVSKVGRSRNSLSLSSLYLSQLVPSIILILVGIVTIWSASLTIPEARFMSHLVGIALGGISAFLIWRYDYRHLTNLTTVLFGLACFLFFMPHIPGIGVAAKGMTGWVSILGFRFQPSEPGKIIMILLMAAVCAQYNGKIETFKDYVKMCSYLLVPLLIIIVTDLGTGLIIFVTGAGIIICSGAPRSWILGTIALVVALVSFVVISSSIEGIPHILKDYQMKRLTVFLDPTVDPSGDGYNLQQAKIAIGSGGMFGKGIGNASQSGQGFLPEAHTDFVFALFAEEFGFVGSLFLLGLYAWMLGATVLLALRIESPFSKLVLAGCTIMWTFQILENIGMCLGMMPITGIPLPFMSFGSSSMITQMAAIGLVQSVWHYRKKAA